jgi:prepilin-type N-terminal cleavage/methylation domain-containing protein
MNKQKKGFTLIELMVVIVIIGILAAIAIPKLFGMSAKAKAAEVGPAAGTWSKLQSAYVVENSRLGSAAAISYKIPGQTTTAAVTTAATSNFEYTVPDPTATDATIVQWNAKAQKGMGDCVDASPNVWTAMYHIDEGASAQLPSGNTIEDGVDPGNACDVLTPNFLKLQ